MEVFIDEKAKNIIEKKGNVFTVKQIACGWAGTYKRLWSEAGSRLEDEKLFSRHQHGNISVFIDKSLNISDKVEIRLKSNNPLFGPMFIVEGVSL